MRSAPISAAVIDINTHELTAEYRRDVAASLPTGINPANIWPDLTAAIAGYYTLIEHRPTKLELKRWRKIVKLTTALDKELSKMQMPRRTLTGDKTIRAALALYPIIQDLAEAHVAGYQMINEAFQRRQNPYRQFLYGAVLDIWNHKLGQPLRFSRPNTMKAAKKQLPIPKGPLIKFFTAVVGPLLGDEMPNAYGIAGIIDRHCDAVANATLKTRIKI